MKEAIGITFKPKGRVYYFDFNDLELKLGDKVIVETDKGLQFAEVSTNLKNINEKNLGTPLKKIIRIASKEDFKQYDKNIKEASTALLEAKKIAKNLELDMQILDASYTFDRNQLIFNFLADGRIDFRELAKKLAQIYHTRIELRQIGVRDKAKEIGGLGPCGRPLCCNTFLTDFASVSINMAKNQYIALNPTKINGVCGRLLCCLNYEDEVYILFT